MEELDIINICVEVKTQLSKMGFEKDNVESDGQLIFPMKKEKKEEKEKKINRISEQELRQLFIEVFKKNHADLYYSIETPTEEKYKFGKTYDDIILNINNYKTSAALDMCVFKRETDEDEYKYNRILNIEFKHGNAPLKDIAKDVLKLMREEQNGAFIFLLDNTNTGSLNNANSSSVNNEIKPKPRMGVLDKLHKSFEDFKEYVNYWKEHDEKRVQLIILSLERKKKSKGPVLIHRTLVNKNYEDLKNFFSINENGGVNITEVSKDSGWQMI